MAGGDPVEEIALQLGDLRITVRQVNQGSRRIVQQSNQPGSSGSLAGPRPVELARATSPTSVSSWEHVEESAEIWSDAWKEALLAADTQESIEQIDLGPVVHLARRLRSGRAEWSPLSRVGRALRAGLAAKTKLSSGCRLRVSSPQLNLTNKVFVVLRPGPSGRVGWTKSPTAYFRAVGSATSSFASESVSHSFPTEAEAEAYCIGAGVRWPPGPLLES